MSQLFNVFMVDAEESRKIAAAPDIPHTHDFEELIIGTAGILEHFIDHKTTILPAPLVSFVTKGKVHRAIPRTEKGKCRMWVLRFQSEFIAETTFQLYSFYHDHAMLKMQKGRCFDRMVTLCELINGEMQETDPDLSVVRHLLSALFSMVESERKKNLPGERISTRAQQSTFQQFLRILEENYHRSEGVDFYAGKLFMSARNLNKICQEVMGKSVSELIETRKLIEAKNLLTHTGKSISEIGFDLGYREKAYFTNVFKKRTGQTPGEFRKEMMGLIS